MNIAPTGVRAQFNAYVRNHLPSWPAVGKTGREILPLGLAAIGIALTGHHFYETAPAIHNCVETTRALLNEHQVIYERACSAMTLGVIPDFIAQRYGIKADPTKHFSFKRLFYMGLIGASVGAIIRKWYDFSNGLLPGNNFSSKLGKVAADQLILTPPLVTAIFAATHPVHGGAFRDALKTGWQKTKDILPLNWLVWGGCFCWIVYSTPQDMKVYVQNLLAIIWHSVVFHQSSLKTGLKAEIEPPEISE